MKRRTKENKEDDTMAKTILVVEDDQNISELLRLYLEKEGYTVNIADSKTPRTGLPARGVRFGCSTAEYQ